MKKNSSKTIVLKIGGSVLTQKGRDSVYIRRKLLNAIAKELLAVQSMDKELKLIIIHGGGSGVHQMAEHYKLATGVNCDKRKWKGAFLTRLETQKLNLEISKIFIHAGLRITPVHTASVVVQEEGMIHSLERTVIDEALRNGCIPLLYGEMVFDTKMGMSICSGDTSAVYLANLYGAQGILFASDVDGLYDKDPYRHKDAVLITDITLVDLLANKDISLTGSHHVDVTGGLRKKITSLCGDGISKSLKEVIILNGLKEGSIKLAIEGKSTGTIIKM